MDAFLVRVPKADADGVLKSADVVRKIIESAEDNGDFKLDLGEYWAALTFMLSGEMPIPKHEALRLGISWDNDSLENVLMGGEPTPFKASFGPARSVDPEQVARLATKLADLSVDEFMKWYDPKELLKERIPPETWDDQSETRALIGHVFEELVAFYKRAAAHGDGILIYLI
jgi:hypothetical protein